MGASSPHPHGQVWASDFVPELPAKEDAQQRAWLAEKGKVLLDMVAEAELAGASRVVESNAHWLAVVPHWAAWPFETLLIARDPVARLEELSPAAREALAAILSRLLRRYDGLFGCDFPYSMGWHGAPHALGDDTAHWRLHAHFFPPLLRSASVRKHMVGFELMAETQRDLTPEQAAERLRADDGDRERVVDLGIGHRLGADAQPFHRLAGIGRRGLERGERVIIRLPVIGRIEAHMIWSAGHRSGFQFERIVRLEDFAQMIDQLQPNPRLRPPRR